MHFRVHAISGLFALSLIVGFTGCSLSEPEPTTQNAALTLQAQQNLSLTVLSWDRVNVTGFKEYIILQSPNPIPESPVPEINTEVTVLKRIDHLDSTTLSVSIQLLTSRICYKLYCAVDDRFLYSDNICIDPEITVVDGFFDRACHEPGNDTVVMFDRVNNQLASLNYKTGTMISVVTDIVLNFPSMEMVTWGNVTHVYGSDQSPAWLRKYTFPSLAASNFKEFNSILWASNAHNQFIFAASQEFNKGFQVLSRNNFSVLDFRNGTTENQNIAVFPGNPITVLTLGSSESKKYLIDDQGKVVSEQFVSGRILQPDRQHNCADGTTLFIGGFNGSIFNTNGENVATLNSNVNAFIQLIRLSPDETKAIYIISNNNDIRLEIVDLSNLASLTKLQSIELPSLSYADIIPDGQVIYILGTTFTSSIPQTFILKYPMP